MSAGDFNGFSSITELNLSGNSLSTLPEGIFDELTSVTKITLDNNRLRSLRSDVFEHNSRLSNLELHNNQLSDLPTEIFEHNAGLRTLNLRNNRLNQLRPSWFEELSNLTNLDLSGNRLTAVPPGAFLQNRALELLDLSDNPISRLQSGTFDNLPKLQELKLNDMMLERIPDGLFDRMTDLRELFLHRNRLGSLQRDLFKNNIFLDVLQLQDNRLTTLPDRIFEHLIELQGLCLAGNPGAAGFRPSATARNIGVVAGGVARLDASGSGGPWGTNVAYEWTSGDSTITPRQIDHFPAVTEFVAPSTPGEIVLTLTVEGAGNRGVGCNPSVDQGFTDTATVTVTVSEACGDTYHGALRLAGDENRTNPEREGRLEVCIVDEDPATRNGWGLVCDDYWTDTAADVACRQLGLPGAIDNRERRTWEALPLPGTYGEVDSSTPIWMDDVICRGDETRLVDCLRRPRRLPDWAYSDGRLWEVESDPFGEHNCRPKEAVGVRCLPTTSAEDPETPGEPETTPREAPAVTATSVIWDFDGYPDAIDVVFQYGEPVSVLTTLGTPAVTLRIGENADNDVLAEYVGGSGSTRLLFRYALPKPFGLSGPVRVVENSLADRGSSIKYLESGTDVPLAHGAATIQPFVTREVELSWTDIDGDDSLGEGDTIEARVTFNEPVNVNTEGTTANLVLDFRDAEDETLIDLFNPPTALYASGSGTSVLVFSYTMAAGDGSPAKVVHYRGALQGDIKSVATDAVLNRDLPAVAELTIDTSSNARVAGAEIVGAPAIGDEGADGVWTPGETVEVTVGFSAAVEVDTAGGTPAIGLQLGGTQARSAAYLRGSGKSQLVFGATRWSTRTGRTAS